MGGFLLHFRLEFTCAPLFTSSSAAKTMAGPLFPMATNIAALRFLATATEHVCLSMKQDASSIALSLPPLQHLSAALDVQIAMTRFTTIVIPQMIVIGNAMRRSLA